MRVTVAELQRFVGGELEIQNEIEGYLYRGRIASIEEQGTDLAFGFIWQAKNRGKPPMVDMDWDVVVPSKNYVISPEIYVVSDIGSGRMALNSFIVNELAVLYPPDGSAINPKSIHGLDPDLMVEQQQRYEAWNGGR